MMDSDKVRNAFYPFPRSQCFFTMVEVKNICRFNFSTVLTNAFYVP